MNKKVIKTEIIDRLELSSFALVMATGIVSIDSYYQGYEKIARLLYYSNIGFYVILLIGLFLRIIISPGVLMEEFKSHEYGPGALTIVCGTAVLGSQILFLGNLPILAFIFFLIAIFLWLFMSYGLLMIFTIKEELSLGKGLGGNWLLFIVSVQTISILLCNLIPEVLEADYLLLCTMLFYIGIFLYIPIITLIIYRFTFRSLNEKQLRPPYWINMGALAISTFAGCVIIEHAHHWPFLEEIIPFLTFLTEAIWSFCAWWIPLILTLGFWHHIIRKNPFIYEVGYWSMVFPIGMFSVATFKILPLLNVKIISTLSTLFFVLSCIAWVLTSLGMLHHFLKLGNTVLKKSLD